MRKEYSLLSSYWDFFLFFKICGKFGEEVNFVFVLESGEIVSFVMVGFLGCWFGIFCFFISFILSMF